MPRSRILHPLLCLLVACASLAASPAEAQSRRSPRSRVTAEPSIPAPKDYRSRNFLVHTDLAAEEAQDLLKRLETMLGIVSRYWGQPNRKTIECYVVKDLANWPQGFFPPAAMASLQNGAGVTHSVISVNTATGRPVASEAIVYAAADHGTPQHESVHAYCFLNFGEAGPTWYSEGMAEMGSYWREDDSAVLLPDVVLQYLQNSDPKPLLGIVDNTDQTGDSWQNYAWRWALCHMLANNPNYAPRFRPLGLSLLQKRGGSFEETYGPMAREIEFEYHFFLNHLENGLRADLVAWDWKAVFKPAQKSRTLAATVLANKGWQPSRLRVQSDKSYHIEATGDWQLAKDGDKLSADGAESGDGKLIGILFDPVTRTLGEPFDLGADLTFEGPADGHLYLRCRDDWPSLGDNAGKLNVRLTLADDAPR